MTARAARLVRLSPKRPRTRPRSKIVYRALGFNGRALTPWYPINMPIPISRGWTVFAIEYQDPDWGGIARGGSALKYISPLAFSAPGTLTLSEAELR